MPQNIIHQCNHFPFVVDGFNIDFSSTSVSDLVDLIYALNHHQHYIRLFEFDVYTLQIDCLEISPGTQQIKITFLIDNPRTQIESVNLSPSEGSELKYLLHEHFTHCV